MQIGRDGAVGIKYGHNVVSPSKLEHPTFLNSSLLALTPLKGPHIPSTLLKYLPDTLSSMLMY